MRVAMISKAVVAGAYQRKLEELARLPDVELVVFSPPLWRDSRGAIRLERVYTSGYQLIETPIALNGHYHLHFYPQLGRELIHVQPELLHVDEEPYNLATWQVIRWGARHGIPTIFFAWQNLKRRYPPPFNWIERHNYQHAVSAIAGNQEAAAVLRAKGFHKPISVIPQFGVDPTLFDAAERGDAGRKRAVAGGARLVVGYAGGLVPEKGVDVLLEAIAFCNHDGTRRETGRDQSTSRPCCHLLIAGEGPERHALEELAGRLGIAAQVTFLGRMGSTAMPDFYRSIDVLVLPSRTRRNWKEQFGRVLIEAMACRVPVIGSDSGEIPHVIGDAGWIFPEGDSHALGTLLARLIDNPGLRTELGVLGRQRVLAHYTQERIVAATYQVYQRARLPRPT